MTLPPVAFAPLTQRARTRIASFLSAVKRLGSAGSAPDNSFAEPTTEEPHTDTGSVYARTWSHNKNGAKGLDFVHHVVVVENNNPPQLWRASPSGGASENGGGTGTYGGTQLERLPGAKQSDVSSFRKPELRRRSCGGRAVSFCRWKAWPKPV
jgi:hypothetical protein